MREQSVEVYFFLIIFAAVLGLTFFMFQPFLGALSLAGVFAVLFYPLFERLKKQFHVGPAVAAGIVVLVLLVVVLAPLTSLGYLLFLETRDAVSHINVGSGDVGRALETVEDYASVFMPGFTIDLREYAGKAVQVLSESLGSIFASTAQTLLSLLLGLIAFFYFLKDGERLGQSIIRHSPLRDEHDREIFERLQGTIGSVVKGSLLIALIQGLLSGVGLAVFGVPNPVLLGMLAGIAALIPAIGTAVVLAPAVVYLFIVGSSGAGLGLLLWSLIAVGLIDNLVGPYLMGRGTQIHPLFILLSVMGGLTLFGPMGFILGPIVLSLLAVLFQIYSLMVTRRS